MARSLEKLQHYERLQQRLKEMPFYIVEYVEYMESRNSSPTTLLNYIHDFEKFFCWAMSEQLLEVKSFKDIPLSFLENLKKTDVQNFLSHLTNKEQYKLASINRKISSLKSLFHFLTTVTEDENNECYFYRNVMAKFSITKDKASEDNRSSRLSKKVLKDGDDKKLIEFIESEYLFQIKDTKKYQYYERDRERDLAIFALFLASGMRVAELAGINIHTLDLKERCVDVVRKGGGDDTVTFFEMAVPYLEKYLEVRKEKYRVPDNEDTLFLTYHGRKCRPITVRTIQNIVNRYTSAYNKRLSPHKLRHSFATKLARNGIPQIEIMRQLGHTSMDTTSLYTNTSLQDRKKLFDEVDNI